MLAALDSSILVAALFTRDAFHSEARQLLLSGTFTAHPHALSETFSTLTGGRLEERLPAKVVASLLREWVLPRVRLVALDPDQVLAAFSEASARGIRGGAIYDYLHLISARIAKARRLYTTDIGDFQAFHRAGDPELALP